MSSLNLLHRGKSDLAVGNIQNIVALGVVFKRKGSEEVVHGVPLSQNNVKVLFEIVNQGIDDAHICSWKCYPYLCLVGSHVP